MKITVVFDSLEEFQKHMTTGRERVEITAQGLTATPAPILEPQEPAGAPEAPEPEKKPENPAEKPQEPAGAAEVPFTEDKPRGPKVTVEEVRKLLADLNKRAGKNVAKDLIKAAGYKKLTDVPAEKLPELKAAAEKEAETYA